VIESPRIAGKRFKILQPPNHRMAWRVIENSIPRATASEQIQSCGNEGSSS